MARPVARNPRGRHAGDGALHVEPFAHENVGEVTLRLDLLEAELAVAEDLVHQLLREDAPRLDVGGDLLLQRLGFRREGGEGRGRPLRRLHAAAALGNDRGDGTRERRDHERQDTSEMHG